VPGQELDMVSFSLDREMRARRIAIRRVGMGFMRSGVSRWSSGMG
jgi:hypothetical protein